MNNSEKIKALDEKILRKQAEIQELTDRRDKIQSDILSSLVKESGFSIDEIMDMVKGNSEDKAGEKTEKTNSPQNGQNLTSVFNNKKEGNI